MFQTMPRVEPRMGPVGLGIATDPEKIQELADEAARKERANAPKPKTPFKKIIREKSGSR